MTVDMMSSLDWVRGAVNEKNLVQVLTHYCIYDGKIYGSNGRISIQAPFPTLQEDPIVVPAGPFYRAIDSCERDPVIELKDDHLLLKSKVRKMRRIRLPLSGEPYDIPVTEGTRYEVPKGYCDALRKIREFVSKDASRPWAMSILHKDGYLYATNNVILVRTPFDWPPEYPIFCLPGFTADEVLRLGQPDHIWVCENGMSYIYAGKGLILRSVMYEATWPNVDTMIPDCSNLPLLPSDFRSVTQDLVPFNEDDKFPVIKYSGKTVETMEGGMLASDELEHEVSEAAFHAVPLQLVLRYADHMDLGPYPKPCPFSGPGIEGVIVGVRV